MSGPIVLEMIDISKTFPGVRALDGVNLTLHAGEVHGLMGENGAGKSTLMKILLGVYQRSGGTIRLRGKEVSYNNPREAIADGICMIHQELNLIPEMTVAENIFLGREPLKNGLVDYKKMCRDAKKLLETLHLNIDPSTKLRKLTVAGQQMVEIAKAVSFDSSILIMDEPTSAISEQEVEQLFNIIRSLTAKGVSVVYISHRMEEIYQICDRITVLRDGQMITSDLSANLTEQMLIQAMVGRTLDQYYPKQYLTPGEVVLKVEDLCLENKFRDVSFEVHAGEVLGFAGMMGAGRTEICETIFGIRRATSGKVTICGKELKARRPYQAVEAGIALVSEDRKLYGLNLVGSVRDNIVLSALKRINSSAVVNDGRLNRVAKEQVERFRIKTPSISTKVSNLSGGNQQKVVLAKWLLCNCRVLILDEPTRGIDIGAKTEIYKLINELAAKGMAIIMVSSEMPEVIGMSDRIVVFSEGRQTGTMDHLQATQERIMRCAMPRKEVV